MTKYSCKLSKHSVNVKTFTEYGRNTKSENMKEIEKN